jgi:hypothetical protein
MSAESLEARLSDRLAHAEQYRNEALRVVRECLELLGLEPTDDEDEED